jgi:deoxyadenosine/deoxycytidine kinase
MAKLFEQPRFIALEGPIRVGKSSLAKILAEGLHARRIVEPENNPFLDRFYAGQTSLGFQTQMWFLHQRYEQLKGINRDELDTPVVADYIFEKDKLFAYINLSDAELALYNSYYQHFREQVTTPDLVIYLQATPEVLKQRLKRKGVPGERTVSDDYLEQVIAAYEHFFFHYTASDLLVVNTSDIDFVNNNRDLKCCSSGSPNRSKGRNIFYP